MLISGIVLATGITYYLVTLTNNQEKIITKIDNLEEEQDNKSQVTVIVPIPENITKGKISSALGSGPIIMNLTK
jgi:hypothetical protein